MCRNDAVTCTFSSRSSNNDVNLHYCTCTFLLTRSPVKLSHYHIAILLQNINWMQNDSETWRVVSFIERCIYVKGDFFRGLSAISTLNNCNDEFHVQSSDANWFWDVLITWKLGNFDVRLVQNGELVVMHTVTTCKWRKGIGKKHMSKYRGRGSW